MKLKTLAFVATAFISCSTLAAEESSKDPLVYVGGSFGTTEFDQTGWGSDDWSSYGAYVGTGILPVVDIEAGYQNFGNFSSYDSNSDAETLYLAARVGMSLGPIGVWGKAGVHSFSLNDVSISDQAQNIDEDDTDFMYGIGANFYATDHVAVGVSYTIFELGDYSKVNVAAATVTFSF
ncbi:porin family protein [Vibrio sp. SS-MA-C1-2]|uniref:porin family protein n=1 Tax=Vibrio sp. SS-MA-C1-2 TaxID=2908646 RepID=UPI001F219239|nr:porin family protein [Vibrio sp. SS-MA-C1-2]UJF17464.1 porin family protein [Vibrio sp. SS-MA-C1-2]